MYTMCKTYGVTKESEGVEEVEEVRWRHGTGG